MERITHDTKLRIGDRVNHCVYGEGVIEDIHESVSILTVLFTDGEVRQVMQPHYWMDKINES